LESVGHKAKASEVIWLLRVYYARWFLSFELYVHLYRSFSSDQGWVYNKKYDVITLPDTVIQ